MHFQELFYTAVCYIPYAIFLFPVVLITPALAFFPGLIRSPLLATCIAIISILIVNTIALILFKLNLYQHSIVIWMAALLAVTAIFRVHRFKNRHPLQWEKSDVYLFLINIGILLPLIAIAGLSSFRSNDALASWNYWALHYYHGETPYTMGYPPFFSIFLSFAYQVLGNTDYQGVVKVLLLAFPLTIMNAIMFINKRTREFIVLYVMLICICVFPGFLKTHFYAFYAAGYADPLLAASIVTSLMLLLKYLSNPLKKDYLWFAVLCGITASLSKQPGLLWCYLGFPALIITKSLKLKKLEKNDLLALIVLFIPAALWLFGPGSTFYNNEGVMLASLQQDHVTWQALVATFFNSVVKYFILQPTLLLVFVLAIVSCRHSIYKSVALLFFIIPGCILWFTLGSYEIRLGLHVLVCCGLLIATDNYLTDRRPVQWALNRFKTWMTFKPKQCAYTFVIVGGSIFIAASFTRQMNLHRFQSAHVYPLNAGLTNCYYFFDNQAEFIYQNIFNNKNIKIFSIDKYFSSIFYGHTQITPRPTELTEEAIYEHLKIYKPDYVFASFCSKGAEDCKALETISSHHPGLLTPIPMHHAKWENRLFKTNKTLL